MLLHVMTKKQYKNKGNENNHFELNYYYYRFISDTHYKQEAGP